jgi:hypothetical protein
VLKDGAKATPEELRAFLAQSFAKWQLPDAFVFLREIPAPAWANSRKSPYTPNSQIGIGKSKRHGLRANLNDTKLSDGSTGERSYSVRKTRRDVLDS